MGSDLSAVEQANAASVAYGAAFEEAYKAVTQGGGDIEAAAVHMRRAGRHLVELVGALQSLHDLLEDQAAAGGRVAGYDLADAVRIVRAAIAFRKAAPRHRWPHQPWGEMAELCAAVDRKPGPDEQTARALPVQPTLAGPRRNAGDDIVHAAIAHPAALYHAMCGGGELDERRTLYASAVPAGKRCAKFGCREAFDGADQAVKA